MTSDLTPYEGVNAIVRDLAARSRETLGDELVALYLHGSLATGAFDPLRSDIDFIAVVARALSDAAIEALRALHRALLREGAPWSRRLEGSFVPAAFLRSTEPPPEPRPYINGESFRMARYGYEWVLERHLMVERAIVVMGPPPTHFIDPVLPEEIVAANRAILTGDWAPMLDDAARLEDAEYQAYAVLTMCRCLYLAAHGAVASKPEAARWAKARYPQWRALIERAAAWAHGEPFDRSDEVRALIAFTLDPTFGVSETPEVFSGRDAPSVVDDDVEG